MSNVIALATESHVVVLAVGESLTLKKVNSQSILVMFVLCSLLV